MRIALIDNLDSFTYNLAHYLEPLCTELVTFRNTDPNCINLDNFDRIVLSPGPGLPSEHQNLMLILEKYKNTKPILGICLGLQAIYIHFGGKLKNLSQVHHGLNIPSFWVEPDSIAHNIPVNFETGRYHSWVADLGSKPNEIVILAIDDEQNPMVIKHKTLPLYAMQFHPESVLTPNGKQLLLNWIKT